MIFSIRLSVCEFLTHNAITFQETAEQIVSNDTAFAKFVGNGKDNDNDEEEEQIEFCNSSINWETFEL